MHAYVRMYKIFNDIITGGNDYVSGPFNITFPAGRTSANFNISIHNDNIFETNESLSLTVDPSSLPSRVMLQSDCMLVITIVDNDGELYVHAYMHV